MHIRYLQSLPLVYSRKPPIDDILSAHNFPIFSCEVICKAKKNCNHDQNNMIYQTLNYG